MESGKNERDVSPAKSIGALVADVMDGLTRSPSQPVHPRNIGAGNGRGGEIASAARVGQLKKMRHGDFQAVPKEATPMRWDCGRDHAATSPLNMSKMERNRSGLNERWMHSKPKTGLRLFGLGDIYRLTVGRKPSGSGTSLTRANSAMRNLAASGILPRNFQFATTLGATDSALATCAFPPKSLMMSFAMTRLITDCDR